MNNPRACQRPALRTAVGPSPEAAGARPWRGCRRVAAHAALVALVAACGPKAPPAPAPAAPAPAAAPAAPAAASAAGHEATGNVVARGSEERNGGAPAVAAPEVDGGPSPAYHGRPLAPLDEAALADVRKTIGATSDLLEEGVTILEAHKAKPERAADALRGWLVKHRARVDETFRSAREVRLRLASAGYDQDIPAEVRTEFEKRMATVQQRLETMREVYRDHVDALEAFGGFFPRVDTHPAGAAGAP